jgi:hypothetical protein
MQRYQHCDDRLGTVDLAVEAIRRARDFIQKQDNTRLLAILNTQSSLGEPCGGGTVGG